MRADDKIKTGRPDRAAALALSDHVLAIADSLFVEKGYGATSMAMVAAEARVGKQTLYRRFPDKAALFREVVRRRIESMFAAALVPQSPAVDPLTELKYLTRVLLDFVLTPEFARLYRVVIAEALMFPELGCATAVQWGSGSMELAANTVLRAQAAGLCRAGDPKLIAKALMWAVIGQAFHDVMAGAGSPFADESQKARHIDQVWDWFMQGVLLPA